jgi:hypothetical protein
LNAFNRSFGFDSYTIGKGTGDANLSKSKLNKRKMNALKRIRLAILMQIAVETRPYSWTIP